MKTKYKLEIYGRTIGAIGIFHTFIIEIILNGERHYLKDIELVAYNKADHIHKLKILSKETFEDLDGEA